MRIKTHNPLVEIHAALSQIIEEEMIEHEKKRRTVEYINRIQDNEDIVEISL